MLFTFLKYLTVLKFYAVNRYVPVRLNHARLHALVITAMC